MEYTIDYKYFMDPTTSYIKKLYFITIKNKYNKEYVLDYNGKIYMEYLPFIKYPYHKDTNCYFDINRAKQKIKKFKLQQLLK